MTTIPKVTLIGAIISSLVAAPAVSLQMVHHKRAHAQSNSFPTYATANDAY
jgi:hypothetical protein